MKLSKGLIKALNHIASSEKGIGDPYIEESSVSYIFVTYESILMTLDDVAWIIQVFKDCLQDDQKVVNFNFTDDQLCSLSIMISK